MSLFTKRTDFATDAQAGFTDQFKRDVMQKLAAIYGRQIQDLETVIFQVLDGRNLNTAIGVQLDNLGAIVGVSRDGADDTRLRIRIRARIKLNLSSGTPDEIIELVQLVQPASVGNPKFIDQFPAGFIIDSSVAGSFTAAEADEVAKAVVESTPAGVRSQFIYGLSAPSLQFAFSATGALVTDANQGFANLLQTTGGALAGVSTND